MNLTNKRILITGGTSGIGLALVKQLCGDNEVVVISRRSELPEELTAGDNPVSLFHADLANKPELETAANFITRRFKSIDVLINNAAIQNTPEFLAEDFEFDGIQREIDANFTAVCHLSYLMLPLLLGDSAAVILNVNSGLAIAPKTSSAIYCGTKGALDVFSQSLRYQLSNTNIDVQQAFLPLVDTNMTRGRGKGKMAADDVAQQIVAGIEKGKQVNDIGKVKLLRALMRVSPSVARSIMRDN